MAAPNFLLSFPFFDRPSGGFLRLPRPTFIRGE
jgi:hypothetical protein